MSKTLDFTARLTTVHNSSHSQLKKIKDTLCWCFVLCQPLWIVAKPSQGIYSAKNIKDRSRKSVFHGWQLFQRTVVLSAVASVMLDFCCWVKSVGLLSAKSLRQISRIKICTDVNLGLYLAVLPYKHDLLFSNVCDCRFNDLGRSRVTPIFLLMSHFLYRSSTFSAKMKKIYRLED